MQTLQTLYFKELSMSIYLYILSILGYTVNVAFEDFFFFLKHTYSYADHVCQSKIKATVC